MTPRHTVQPSGAYDLSFEEVVAVLDDEPRVARVEVVVRKMRPPVDVDVGSVGVRVVDVRRP